MVVASISGLMVMSTEVSSSKTKLMVMEFLSHLMANQLFMVNGKVIKSMELVRKFRLITMSTLVNLLAVRNMELEVSNGLTALVILVTFFKIRYKAVALTFGQMAKNI